MTKDIQYQMNKKVPIKFLLPEKKPRKATTMISLSKTHLRLQSRTNKQGELTKR